MNSFPARPTVAVGVNSSPEAVTAARYAVSLARDRHADLLLVCAYQFPSALPGMTAAMIEATRASAERAVASVVAKLTLPPTMRVNTVVELASPDTLLCRVALTAEVVVIGVHHFNLDDQLLTGLIASPVAANAVCPVVVVPRKWSRTWTGFGSIFVALDGQTAALPVLDFAFAEAERLRSCVTALHATPWAARSDSGADTRIAISEIISGHRQAHPDLLVRTLVLQGDPAEVIILKSTDADMVVVGRPHRQGHGAWNRSVARAVLDQAHCPLVVVPPQHTPEVMTAVAGGHQEQHGTRTGRDALPIR